MGIGDLRSYKKQLNVSFAFLLLLYKLLVSKVFCRLDDTSVCLSDVFVNDLTELMAGGLNVYRSLLLGMVVYLNCGDKRFFYYLIFAA